MYNETNRTVTSSSGDGEIPVWTADAGEGSRPGVLLMPTIFGVDEGSKTLARDLASSGAHVWVVDQFWRTSPGAITPRDKDSFAKGVARAKDLDMKLAIADATDLILAMAQEAGCNGKVVALGVCFAGKFALLLTSQGHAAAGASFHGTGIAAIVDLEKQISAPLSLHFGDEDVATPVEDVAVIQEAFKGHENVEVFLHKGGVQHGFGDPGSDELDPGVYKKLLVAVHGLLDSLR